MNKDINNNNNNEYNIKLYNSVFNNIYLKSIIFHHLNIFNILLPVNIRFGSIDELQQFKYKDYLNIVRLDFNDYDLNQLPDNIRHIIIPSPTEHSTQIFNSIHNHVESIGFSKNLEPFQLDLINIGSSSGGNSSKSTINSTLLSKLKHIGLDISNNKNTFTIPSSITKLDIVGSPKSDFFLGKNLLPSNLKELKYRIRSGSSSGRVISFEDGCLPESLTHVVFSHLDNPKVVNQLSLNALVKLEFSCDIDISSDIRFPNTLQSLDIFHCHSFNATLPSSLKSFIIIMERYKHEIQFPSSLEHLEINFYKNVLKKQVFQSRHSVPIKLKSLEINCSSIVDSNGHPVLPDSLETLLLWDFDQVLNENQLPSSLTHLNLGSEFQQAIDINVLPSSLKTLELHSYSQVINPLAIPSNLRLLRVLYKDNHPINLTPSSHPNTVIDCNNLNSYYDPSNTDIRVLKLPDQFDSPLSTLQLHDKCNLNYLHLGYDFNHPIQQSDLPINNQIRILELNFRFTHTINLEYFQNLESIIIYGGYSSSGKLLNITTTINDNGTYNYYKFKEIQLSNSNSNSNSIFIKYLDINFYKFIKLIKS